MFNIFSATHVVLKTLLLSMKKTGIILSIVGAILCLLGGYSYWLATPTVLDVPLPVYSNGNIRTNFFKYSKGLYFIELRSPSLINMMKSPSLNNMKEGEIIPCDIFLKVSSKEKVYLETNITSLRTWVSYIRLCHLNVGPMGSYHFNLTNRSELPFKEGEFNLKIILSPGEWLTHLMRFILSLGLGIMIGVAGIITLIRSCNKRKVQLQS